MTSRPQTRHRKRTLLIGIITALVLTTAAPVDADIVTPISETINFDEYPFPAASTGGVQIQGPGGSSTVSYNLFEDVSGTKLLSDNGDLDDVTMTYTATVGGANGASSRPRVVIRNPSGTYQLTGQSGYSGTVPGNNPGTRQSTSLEVRFADHLDVDAVTLDTSSLNTAGNTWEFSVITFLDTDGNPFSSVPIIPLHQAYGAGFTGSSGTGHFIAASTLTVVGVGTPTTSGGVNGPADNSSFDISTGIVTIPAGQSIGGFIITTTLEDVRGTTNGATSFSSSLRVVSFSGHITQETEDADLSIVKTGVYQAPDQIVYTIEVSNSGPDTSTNVAVSDPFPAEVTYVSDDCGGTPGNPWIWSVGTLNSGDSVTCNVVTQTTGPGDVSNTASVTSDSIDIDLDNNASTAVVNVPFPTTTTSSTSTTTTSTTSTTSTTLAGSTTTSTTLAGSTTTAGPTTTDPGTEVDDAGLETLPLTGADPGRFLLGAVILGAGRRRTVAR